MLLNELFEEVSRPTIQDILDDTLPKIRKILQQKYGEPIGSGRNRETYAKNNIVIKMPLNEYGMHDNYHEKNTYKHNRDDVYAKCKLIHVFDIPILVMEKLRTPNDDEYDKLPKWTDTIDGRQVGYNRKGNLQAYDYGYY